MTKAKEKLQQAVLSKYKTTARLVAFGVKRMSHCANVTELVLVELLFNELLGRREPI